MTPSPATPDFSGWALDRLTAQKEHLESLLAVSAGQNDPVRPKLRAEHEAVRAEIASRITLADRITSVLEGTGFRPYSDMPAEATHHSGPFFLVTEGVGATVSVAWTDATDIERGVMLHRYAIRLHEVGLDAERRDGYLYVTEAGSRL